MFCTAFALTLGLSVSSQCPNDPYEITYQTLHAIDYGQTVTGARSPECMEETDGLTSKIVGRHPSVGKVEAWWAVESMIHYAISGWLDRTVEAEGSKGWRVARWGWRAFSIGTEAYAVGHNFNLGVHPFGGDVCPRLTGHKAHER